MDRPVSLKDLLARYREPIVIYEPLVTPDGVALAITPSLWSERAGAVMRAPRLQARVFHSLLNRARMAG